MFNLKKLFGEWVLKQNGKIIFKGTLEQCVEEFEKINKNKKIQKNSKKPIDIH